MAKFSKDGYKIEVVENLKSGQYLVRRIFSGTADGWDDECEYPGEELSVVDEVFDHAPTQKLEAIVAGLREQIKNLQHEKANLAQEIRDTEEAGRAKLAKYKKYDQLKNLDVFLDGKITHYVLEYWGSFKIISLTTICPYCSKEIEVAIHRWWVGDSVINFDLECPECGKTMEIDVEMDPVFLIYKKSKAKPND